MASPMETAATAADITFTKQPGQVALLRRVQTLREMAGGEGGICYGLAWVWMQCKANGSTSTLWDDLAAAQHKPNTVKAARLYKDVQGFGGTGDNEAAAQCGFTLIPKNADAGIGNKIQYVNIAYPADLKTLAEWLGKAMGDRFFLLSTDLHVMAASGSKLGKLEFYDPNFGVVSCWKSSGMLAFFKAFFADPVIRGYWTDAPRRMKVTKVKVKG